MEPENLGMTQRTDYEKRNFVFPHRFLSVKVTESFQNLASSLFFYPSEEKMFLLNRIKNKSFFFLILQDVAVAEFLRMLILDDFQIVVLSDKRKHATSIGTVWFFFIFL